MQRHPKTRMQTKLKVPLGIRSNTNAHSSQFKSAATVEREVQEGLRRRRNFLMLLPTQTHSALSGIATSSGTSPDDDIGLSGLAYDMDLFDATDGQEISHEGGEFSDAVKCTLEFAAQSKRGNSRYGKGAQARRQRLKMMYAHWDAQMEQLADTYLEWKHGPQVSALMEEDGHEFHVSVIGTFERNNCVLIHQRIEEPANVALLRHGLLGCSPVEPTVAIELCTLELYHRL
ncbi:hypothetical protein EV702DRAFT_1199802 [Suillus placidus]|uniref:Uncharacterized protein n=1 Tax=Suillus placidus TaxID=48579 RepID=A0A9P7D0U0_9AGAM|nr:hypothetical protein EV702DRAFT_1199802 [Suillus placidus]